MVEQFFPKKRGTACKVLTIRGITERTLLIQAKKWLESLNLMVNFLFVIVAWGWLLVCVSSSTSSFIFTGGAQTFTVPSGVNFLTVNLTGASGGKCGSYPGGSGGFIACTFSVTAGQVLSLYLGGVGSCNLVGAVGAGGYNGGGSTVITTTPAANTNAGGGGGTDIRISPFALSNRIVVAGSGGGSNAGDTTNGGMGGYPSGSAGQSGSLGGGRTGGSGGTQTAGGASSAYSACTSANNGAFGVGAPACVQYGGGGGGGWYGGGGGGGSAGGGGSSYCSGTINSYQNGVNQGSGFAVIS